MGTLIGHIIPGLILTILGIQHLISTIKSYYLNHSKFVSKFSYQFNTIPKLKHLEHILILAFSIFSISSETLDFILKSNLKSLEHATMFLQLALFAGFSLYTDLKNTPQSSMAAFLGIMASSVFSQELFLLHFHSADHAGLEGHYHWLLQLIVSISLVSCVAMSVSPSSFLFALVLPVSIIFQGCWFTNMGLMLWTPRFVPQGCHVQAADALKGMVHSAVMCGTQEEDSRARALANLQFSWILAGVLLFTGFSCLIMNQKHDSSQSTNAYEQLQTRGADVSVSIDGLKQVQL